MPVDTRLILTQNVYLSNLTDMRDGNPQRFTTPSFSTYNPEGLPLGTEFDIELLIPAFTNRNPVTPGVGAFSATIMTAVAQGNPGDPTVEANWYDVGPLISVLGAGYIRPLVPAGSTGVGTVANPVRSNRAVARIGGRYYTNYRISGQFIGSYPDFSNVFAFGHYGARNLDAELV